ncbi:MAG: ChbG/HpnK family deacetylase [Planctomycetota bacterium]|nr:ChbG/HpnK family deacetylase [Planctomycetota bacterium]
MKRLIVNADDFGWSEAVTSGILRAHRDGLVTSTTLMANLPGAEAALQRARREAPGLGIGLHLNLTEGRPLTGDAATPLTDGEGQFIRSLVRLARLVRTSAAALLAAEREWEAQVLWARDHGLRPTHLDGHKHVHLVPALAPSAIALARKHGIPAIRTTAEWRPAGISRLLPREWRAKDRLRQMLWAWVGRRWGVAAQRAAREAGLATTNWFFGLRATGGISAELIEYMLRHAPDGTGELMVHPGEADASPARPTRLGASRPAELAALCDPRARRAAEENGWTLINYEGLKS